MIRNNYKNTVFFSLLFILGFLLIPNPVHSSPVTISQTFDSGVLDLVYQDKVVGSLVYKSVHDNNSAVTTLEPDYGGIAPFHPYYAESLTVNDTKFYLSHTIVGFEIFEDTNSNGYIDSHEEIKYFVMLNATQGFTFGAITKTSTLDGTVYKWTSSYFDIDGFLVQGGDEPVSSQPPGTYTTSVIGFFSLKDSSIVNPSFKNAQESDLMKTIISSFNISYTVKVTDNYTDLSIEYDIGSWDAYTFTFDDSFNEVRTGTVDLSGLGLSILYTSVVRSNMDVQTIETSVDDVLSGIKIVSNNATLFEADLDDSYRLGGNTEKMAVKTVIAPPDTFLQDQTLQWTLFDDFLEDLREWYDSDFDLPAIPSTDIPIQKVFNYRIAYPTWSGEVINHDPIYRINKFDSILEEIFKFPQLDTGQIIIIASVSGFLMIGIVLIVEKRRLI